MSVVHEAYEQLSGDRQAPLLLTCEHASERLPEGWQWPEADGRLRGSHWAYDLGAREVVHELSAALAAPAVLSRFSRLLIDPNRELDHADLFRAHAEGEPVALNLAIDAEDRRRRIEGYYAPFYAAVEHAVREHAAPVLLSVHSFTPVYEGQPRSVELGVLFNDDETLALRLFDLLAARLSHVALNEPWSGKEGLIHSVESHARREGRQALELEVRQDLAQDPAYRARLVAAVAEFFRAG